MNSGFPKTTIAAGLLLLFLAASASREAYSRPERPQTLDQIIPVMTNVPMDSGVVILKVQTGQNEGFTTFSQSWAQLRVTGASGTGTSEYRTNNLQSDRASHMFFIWVLPAGTYRLAELSSIDLNYTPRATAWAGLCACDREIALFGIENGAILQLADSRQFSVRPGEINDLGTLAVIPESRVPTIEPRGSTRGVTALPLPNAPVESARLLSMLRDKLPAHLKLRADNPWIQSAADSEKRQARLRQGLSWNFLMNPNPDTSQGIYAEDFGQIRVRENRQWKWLDTGLSMHVKSVANLEDGTLLAGASHGIVLARAAGSEDWRDISLPILDGDVLSIGQHKDAGLIATAHSGGELVVFNSKSVGAAWSEVRRMPAYGRQFTNIQLSTGTHGLLAAVIEFGSTYDAQLHHLDGSTMAWSTNPIPKNFAGIPGSIAVNPDGSVYQLQGGIRFSANGSHDFGRSWYKLSVSKDFRHVRMLDQRTGYALTKSGDSPFGLSKTEDGGRTWARLGPAPAQFIWLKQIAQDELAAMGGSFKVYLSSDGGKSWHEDDTRTSQLTSASGVAAIEQTSPSH